LPPEEIDAIARFIEAHAVLWSGRPTLAGVVWTMYCLGYRKVEPPADVPWPPPAPQAPATPPVDALFSAGIRRSDS